MHDHAHGHVHADTDARRLGTAFALIVAFMVAEVVAGIVGSSLALLSDAGHMLTDAVALGLALLALRLADRPPAGSFTYGMKRAEILSAQINGVTLLLLGAADHLRGHPPADRAAGRRGRARPHRGGGRDRREPASPPACSPGRSAAA